MTMFDIPSLCILGLVFFLTYYYMKGRKPANFPPGPDGYPFIGNLNMIWKNTKLHRTLHELTPQYGDKIFGLQLGIMPAVVVSDFDLLKELFTEASDNFNIRPQMMLLKLLFENKGIIFNKGKSLKLMRRMALTTMKDLGVGKTSIESRILGEADFLLQEIAKQRGERFQPNYLFYQAVGNILCIILFGDRMSYEDPEYQQLLTNLVKSFSNGGFQNVLLFLPSFVLPLLPLIQPQVFPFISGNLFLRKFITKKIDEHRNTFDPENIRDFIDVYLDCQRVDKDQTCTDAGIFQTIMDMFNAGVETTSTTFLWICYFLIKYPHIQGRCREEIVQLLGDRCPSQNDYKKLPLVEATICEIQRCANTGPLLLMHANESNAEVCGYQIPAGTVVIPNLYTIFNNPKHFPEPHAFNPDRFLDKEGNFKRNDALIPFGIGKRACIGEYLAKMELFLFLTKILQKFELSTPDQDKLPGINDTNLGITNVIQPYDIIATPL